jgi:hypothetical protein
MIGILYNVMSTNNYFLNVNCQMLKDVSGVVMAAISKQRRNEASILASFSISKRNKPAYSRTCKDRSEANPAYSTP